MYGLSEKAVVVVLWICGQLGACGELAAAQGRLGSAVGELQRAFGATIEEEAAGVVEVVLRRKGYRVLQPAYSLALDGEIDVVLPLEDLSGEQVWAVVKAKARLSRRDVHQWAQRMRSAGWRERLAERGVKGGANDHSGSVGRRPPCDARGHPHHPGKSG